MNLRVDKDKKLDENKYYYIVFYTFITPANTTGNGFVEVGWRRSIKYAEDLVKIIAEIKSIKTNNIKDLTITGYNLLRIEGEEDGTESGEKEERTKDDQQVPQTT